MRRQIWMVLRRKGDTFEVEYPDWCNARACT